LPSFITLILTSVYPFKTRSQPLTTVGTKFNVFSFINNLSESRFWAYFLVLPSFVLVSAVILYPIVSGILLSFRQMRLNRPTLGTGYIGLEHYSTLLQDAVFKQAVINTVVWVGVGVASQFLLGLLTALALSRPMRGMRLARVFVLIPWILPTVVAGNIWALMLDARLGVINDILLRLGIIPDYKAWFATPEVAFPAVLLVALWQGFPFLRCYCWLDCKAFRKSCTKRRQSMAQPVCRNYFT